VRECSRLEPWKVVLIWLSDALAAVWFLRYVLGGLFLPLPTIDRLKVRFMADKVGESFDGIVSGATDFGLFVELLDWFVGGAVTMADLDDDHYFFDEKHHRLAGRYTGKVYQIGDLVWVTVKSVEVQQRRVNFVMAPQRSEKK
jgi:ribonuclease R